MKYPSDTKRITTKDMEAKARAIFKGGLLDTFANYKKNGWRVETCLTP